MAAWTATQILDSSDGFEYQRQTPEPLIQPRQRFGVRSGVWCVRSENCLAGNVRQFNGNGQCSTRGQERHSQ